jgi:predicted O-methyltransferase YrrM
MSAADVLKEVLDSGQVRDATGARFPLHSHVDAAKGAFLQHWVGQSAPAAVLEIGCAYGISSLYIQEALEGKACSHTIIDPQQETEWKGIGRYLLESAGCSGIRFMEEGSETALPELLRQQARFDFVFIDGWHTFDHVLVDFFYVNRLCTPGAVVVFDDADFPSIRSLLAYLEQYPQWKRVDALEWPLSRQRRFYARSIQLVARCISAFFPREYREHIFHLGALKKGKPLRDPSRMVALRKTGEDTRNWDWWKPF